MQLLRIVSCLGLLLLSLWSTPKPTSLQVATDDTL